MARLDLDGKNPPHSSGAATHVPARVNHSSHLRTLFQVRNAMVARPDWGSINPVIPDGGKHRPESIIPTTTALRTLSIQRSLT